MNDKEEEKMCESIFAILPSIIHTPKESVVSETAIPGSDYVFCLQGISYEDGKIHIKTSIEARERKRKSDGTSFIEDSVILEDYYVLDVKRLLPAKKKESEPLNIHSH